MLIQVQGMSGRQEAGNRFQRWILFLLFCLPPLVQILLPLSLYRPPPLFLCLFLKLFQMERRRERVSRGLLLITLLLLLLYNLLIFPRSTVMRPSNNEKGEYFTTGDSLDSQTRDSEAENKGKDLQNRDSEAKNKAKPDELESARQTNKLRLQHLERACEEVDNHYIFWCKALWPF